MKNISKLFDMQRELDQHIETQHNLQQEDLFDRKILALLVELGELANETRCFKFWSVKPASPKEVILEEFVDGIHFILSLGIERGFESVELPTVINPIEDTLNQQFLALYQHISLLQKEQTFEAYQNVFIQFFGLALLFGFKQDEIEEAYIRKNEVNYERQQKGY